jgi:adenine-specific DNA-methyltransferase
MKSEKNNLGQYFTTSDDLQQFIFDKVKHKSFMLLEPSFGKGHLLKKFKEYNDDYPMTCYELDNTIVPDITFNSNQTIIYGDFTKQNITQKFKTIIGNPPYIKHNKSNIYLTFIELCYNYLADDGELLFIVPSNFMKLTSASHLINKMTETGSFTHFLFPNNEKLFENANIDVVLFRYEKGLYTNCVIVNDKEMNCNIHRGIITFSNDEIEGMHVDELFNVYVGMVTGKDEVYRVPFGNINVLVNKDCIEKFIYVDTFPTNNDDINHHLLKHQTELIDRKIRKFSETNWFQWGAARNMSTIQKYRDRQCIYIKTMTRNSDVAFIDKVQYFGGTLLCLIPKNDIEPSVLQNIVKYMNSDAFKKDYLYSGRFKVGQKQISSAILPNSLLVL